MRRKFVLLALRYEGLKLLLLRRTLAELRENHTLALQAELAGLVHYIDRERAFIFPNGSRLKLGYCDSESDVLQYQGQEYDVIGLEEATHFTEYQRDFLTTCNRSVRGNFKPRMYYTGNPGGVGHGWFKRLFIDRQYRGAEQAGDYVFIPARVYDNSVLIKANPEYVRSLENLPHVLRRAHLDGDWDVFAGQFFPEFSREAHVIPPTEIPKEWLRFRSMDYGMDMTACYWWAVAREGYEPAGRDKANMPAGSCFIYRELYEPRLTLSKAAQRILELTASDENIRYTVASPDLWSNRQESGTGGVVIMAKEGLTGLVKAVSGRVNGWRMLREYLAENDDNAPKLRIFANCVNAVRTLPLLQHDRLRVEDAASEPHEVTHAPEAIRYGVMSRPLMPRASEEPQGFYTPSEREDFKLTGKFEIRKIR
jgi:phage terminase large subunit